MRTSNISFSSTLNETIYPVDTATFPVNLRKIFLAVTPPYELRVNGKNGNGKNGNGKLGNGKLGNGKKGNR